MFFNDENEFDIYSDNLSDDLNDNIDDDDPYAFDDDDPYSFGDEDSTTNDENVDFELEKQIAEEKHKMEMARLEAQRKSRERLGQLNKGAFSASAAPTTSISVAPVSAFDTSLDTSSNISDIFVEQNPYAFEDNYVTTQRVADSSDATSDTQVKMMKPIVVEKYLVKKVVQTNKITVIFSWLISFGITAGLALILLAYFGVDESRVGGLAAQFSFLENDIWWVAAGATVGLLLALLLTMIIMIVFLHKKTTIINITIKEKAEQMAAKEALVQRAREEAIRRYKIEKAKRVIADHQKKKDVIEKSKKDVSTVASLKKLIFNSEEINDYALTTSNFEKLVISPRIIQDGNKLNILKNYNNVFINQFKLINSPFAENKEFEATSDKLHELLQIKNNANLKLISPFYLYEVSNVETGLSLSTWEMDSEKVKQILITKPTKIKNNFLITNSNIPVSNDFISKLFSEKLSYENKEDERDMNLIIYSNNSEIKDDLKETINSFSNYLEKTPETQILILDGICYISSIVSIGFMEPELDDKSADEIKKILIDQIKIDAKFFKRLNKTI